MNYRYYSGLLPEFLNLGLREWSGVKEWVILNVLGCPWTGPSSWEKGKRNTYLKWSLVRSSTLNASLPKPRYWWHGGTIGAASSAESEGQCPCSWAAGWLLPDPPRRRRDSFNLYLTPYILGPLPGTLSALHISSTVKWSICFVWHTNWSAHIWLKLLNMIKHWSKVV